MATRVGLGSWADDDYVGTLYPKKLPKNERLHRYAQLFDRLEGAFGYHRLPSRKQVEGWGNETPEGFTFDIKLHRDFSDHPAATAKTDKVKWTVDGVQPLVDAKKFGVFMMTLPPSFSPKGSKLETIAHFDNSTKNPQNPDPSRAVRFGEQTWEEMMNGFFDFVPVNQNPAKPAASSSSRTR